MIVCAIETTGPHLGICIVSETKTRAFRESFFEERPMKQSDALIPTLGGMLKSLKLKKSDVDAWAVDVGPGSFTGVRVGVAAARAFAQAFNKPLVGVCSLEAMADAVEAGAHPTLVTATRPALAGEVYGAVYMKKNGRMTPVVAPVWCKEADFKKKKSVAIRSHKTADRCEVNSDPRPESVASLALQKLSGRLRKDAFLFSSVVPMYLQPSWAERSK